MSGGRIIHWFRSDLRLSDNTSLHAAATAATRGVLCVFVLSPQEWKSHDISGAQIDLRLRCLASVAAGLQDRNIPLKILDCERADRVAEELLSLATRFEADAIYFNEEYEVDEQRRDARVQDVFVRAGRTVRKFTDQSLMDPRSIRTQAGGYFTVFTPFRKAWLRNFDELSAKTDPVATLPPPPAQVPLNIESDRVPVAIDGFDPHVARRELAVLWPADEVVTEGMLDTFIRRNGAGYGSTRNIPALESTSRLSAALAVGSISVRQCLRVARQANGDALDIGKPGLSTWISELIWREFYIHVTTGFPRVCMGRAFKPATERIRWSDNAAHLEAWKAGRTGFPIVDAAMRQLQTTAWMHNRLRMVTAMFLTKDLFLDWRQGERFFMRHLIDGFFASNNGGWQWSASTGTDAAPYFRIFNPTSQSIACDPEGTFIRTMIPELATVPKEDIHDPPPLLRARLGYPMPIVDHSVARDRVLAAFKSLS